MCIYIYPIQIIPTKIINLFWTCSPLLNDNAVLLQIFKKDKVINFISLNMQAVHVISEPIIYQTPRHHPLGPSIYILHRFSVIVAIQSP